MAFSDGSWSQRDVRNEERFLIHQEIRRKYPNEQDEKVLSELYRKRCIQAGLSPDYEYPNRSVWVPREGDYEHDNFHAWFCDPYKSVVN